MMIVLGFDTSSQAATVAICDDGIILGEYTLNHKKTHSVKMLPLIENLLADVELAMEDIDVFACGIGPGSFTGLRIGVATAKGFAQAMKKETVGISSLEILANNAGEFEGFVVPMIFARVDEVFCAVYSNEGEVLKPCVMTIYELLKISAGKKCVFLGDGAVVHGDRIKDIMGEFAFFAKPCHNIIRGASVAELAYFKALKGEFTDYNELSPVYLRPSQAEREYAEEKK